MMKYIINRTVSKIRLIYFLIFAKDIIMIFDS